VQIITFHVPSLEREERSTTGAGFGDDLDLDWDWDLDSALTTIAIILTFWNVFVVHGLMVRWVKTG
jgi:hypothetical protein